MSVKQRLRYITTEQKEALIEFMKENPQLKAGKFSANFTVKDAQRKWMTIIEELHKIPNGATKDWKQWRKTWQDLCTKTKAKQSHINKYIHKTGGGPPLSASDQLSPSEQQILEAFHTTAISGHNNIAETEVSFDFANVEYLEDYQHVSGSEGMCMEQMDTSENYSQVTTCSMQNLDAEDGTSTVANENNIAMVTNKEIHNNKTDKNVPTKNRKKNMCAK